MEIEELTEALNECLDYGNKACFSEKVDLLLNQVNEERATELLASYLYNRYTTYNADSIAGLMEMIIRKNINVGFVNFPDNDLFDCYVEEFCQPYLEKNKTIDAAELYIGLVPVVEFYIEEQAAQEQPLIKGVHFNGAFGRSEELPNAVLINSEDYEQMNATVEKYNALVGRKAILKKLNYIIDNL